MDKTQLAGLAQVTDALYLREFEKIKSILEEEARLLENLSRLDDQVRGNRDPDVTVRSLGADLLWQGWEERTRRQLNMELAQVRARKLVMMEKVRTAFGRKQMIEDMMAQARSDRDRLKRVRAQERLMQAHTRQES